MSLEQKLQQIEELQEKIHAYGKLPDDVLKKIDYKLRLEWNYTSNSMEGNSLTKSETRSVMIGNITVSGKPIKDVLEVKGHDEVISTIMKMGKGELNLSEKRIRDIHTGIMHEEDPEKKVQIGQWKKDKNYLYNYKNERFDFVAPADVPERMHQLVNWVNAERDRITRQDKAALHPVLLALRFNLEYVTIHPFYDGNGRTIRILTNLILIAYGYPPLYIRENERNAYYQYLGDIQGYGGAPDVFFEYMAGLIIRSQELILTAIEGKDIDEPDDLDKKIKMLEMELRSTDAEEHIRMKYSKETFLYCCDGWMARFVEKVTPVIQKFNRFFMGTQHRVFVHPGDVYVEFVNESPQQVSQMFVEGVHNKIENIGRLPTTLTIQTFYGTFTSGGLQTFGCNYYVNVKMDEVKYEVWVDDCSEGTGEKVEVKKYERLYHQHLTEQEMDNIANMLGNTIYKHIDYNTRKRGIRK